MCLEDQAVKIKNTGAGWLISGSCFQSFGVTMHHRAEIVFRERNRETQHLDVLPRFGVKKSYRNQTLGEARRTT
jgi:hypothetical protein